MSSPLFMSLGRWLQRQCRQGQRVTPYVRRQSARLRLEWLEDRVVPATFDVISTADVLNQAGTLRNAIQLANTNGQAHNTINILTPGTYALTLAGTNTNVVGTNVTNGGTGYTSAPTVTFTGGGGTGATATAIVNNGSVIGLIVTNAGTGYTTAPTISFSGGGSTGAAATAEVGENDNAAGELAVTLQSGGSLTINNQSGGAVVIDVQGHSRAFDINPNNTPLVSMGSVTLDGITGVLTVTNGHAGPNGDPAGSGGDIRANGPVNLTLNNVTVSNGSGGGDGGGIAMENIPTSPSWTLNLNQSTVSNNHAEGAGGGVEADGGGSVTINNSLVTGNTSAKQGGGIWLDAIANLTTGEPETANLTIAQSVISNNSAGLLGGGLGNAGDGAVAGVNSAVSGNVTQGFGGGFADQNNLGTLNVQNSLFQNNSATGDGGALFAGGPSTTIGNSQFQGNAALGSGGALFLGQNGAGTPATASSVFTLVGSTFADNVANGSGGGIEFETTTGTPNSTSTATITNVTLSGDGALTVTGGGINVAGGFNGTVTLTADTITNNFAATTGGVAFADAAGGAVNVQDTIIALNNGTDPDVSSGAGTFTDLGNNVVGVLGGSTGFLPSTITGPFTGTLVSGLRDNGGPTAGVTQLFGAGLVVNSPIGNALTVQTESLLPTSPARDKGAVIAGLTTDERGLPRPGTTPFTAPDIGAFEFQDASLLIQQLTATADIIEQPHGVLGPITITIVVQANRSLPDDKSILTVTLAPGLVTSDPTMYTLPAMPSGQTVTFTLTAGSTFLGGSGLPITVTIVSPDANPVIATAAVTTHLPPPVPVNGQLMVFALGFVNSQFVLFYVDPVGHIFDEPFTFNNFFSPDPASAVFFNFNLVVRNMAPTDIFGSPGIVGFILDVNGNADLATTVPLNFIAAAALQDLITALQQPGA